MVDGDIFPINKPCERVKLIFECKNLHWIKLEASLRQIKFLQFRSFATLHEDLPLPVRAENFALHSVF